MGEAETLRLRGLAGYIIERSDTPLGGQPLDQAGWLATPDFTAVLSLDEGRNREGCKVPPWTLRVSLTEGISSGS